jgi:hypothetical protein
MMLALVGHLISDNSKSNSEQADFRRRGPVTLPVDESYAMIERFAAAT